MTAFTYPDPIPHDWFFYGKCCRVHKLVIGARIGRCGLCNEPPATPATEAEYLAQPPIQRKEMNV